MEEDHILKRRSSKYDGNLILVKYRRIPKMNKIHVVVFNKGSDENFEEYCSEMFLDGESVKGIFGEIFAEEVSVYMHKTKYTNKIFVNSSKKE